MHFIQLLILFFQLYIRHFSWQNSSTFLLIQFANNKPIFSMKPLLLSNWFRLHFLIFKQPVSNQAASRFETHSKTPKNLNIWATSASIFQFDVKLNFLSFYQPGIQVLKKSHFGQEVQVMVIKARLLFVKFQHFPIFQLCDFQF